MPVSTALTLTVQLGEPGVVASYLERQGVLRRGHFRLLSGLHTDTFLAFSRIAETAEALDTLTRWLTPTVAAWTPTCIVAPPTAGVGLAATLARGLGCRVALADLDDHGRAVAFGRAKVNGERVLLVNDVVTTGEGLRRLSNVVRDAGGSPIGASWFISRSPIDVAELLGAPVAYVADLPLAASAAEGCEMCRREEPIEEALDLN